MNMLPCVHASPPQVVEAMNMHEGHQDDVEDVAWHRFNPHLFGSVGDDKQLILWDTRKPGTALRAVQVHGREVYGLAFNPANPCLLATCSSDTSVGLRDWRNLSEPLHVLQAHTGDVLQVGVDVLTGPGVF
jgi:histone-binding protein RBBP4